MSEVAHDAAEIAELRSRVAELEALVKLLVAPGRVNHSDVATASGSNVRKEPLQAQPEPDSKHGGKAAPTQASPEPPVCSIPPAPPSPQAAVPVAMAATRVVMHQLVLPADVNQLGICTGGQVLSWIDLCAGLSAKTLAHGPCVTASVDAVHFLRPTRLGCVVIIAALVSRTFHTSMEVTVVVESEDMRTGIRHHCCSAHLTFVVRPRDAGGGGSGAAGGGGVGLPRVHPTTPDHRAVWEGAEVRRQQRLERRARLRNSPALRDAERMCRLEPITHREGGPTLPPAVTLLPQHGPGAGARWPSRSASLTLSPAVSRHGPSPFDHHTAFAAPAAAAVPQAGVVASGEQGAGGGGGAVADAKVAATPMVPPPLPPASPPAPVLPPPRQRVPPGCTTAYMTQSILPQHANTLHITFGGQVMSWIEQCAYISASRLRAPSLLTAAMDSVTFVRPTRVGDILYITAQATAIFGSSLEVMVSVYGESPYVGVGSSAAAAADASSASSATVVAGSAGADSGGIGGGAAGNGDVCGIFHCADAYVTVVAVDERHGTPVPVPFELDPKEPADVLRYQGAVARRAERLALRGQFAAAECTRVSLDGGHTYSPPSEASESTSVLDAIPPL